MRDAETNGDAGSSQRVSRSFVLSMFFGGAAFVVGIILLSRYDTYGKPSGTFWLLPGGLLALGMGGSHMFAFFESRIRKSDAAKKEAQKMLYVPLYFATALAIFALIVGPYTPDPESPFPKALGPWADVLDHVLFWNRLWLGVAAGLGVPIFVLEKKFRWSPGHEDE